MKEKKDFNETPVTENVTGADFNTEKEEKNVKAKETSKKEKSDKPKTATKKVVEPLEDYDEIEVVSLIPNVTYKDSKTGDMYEWDTIGHIEYMTFDTLKTLWRSHKGYFKNMWLKPNDERVINKFGLTKTFEKYEFLMDEENYTKKNINEICKAISETPIGLKYSVFNKIKNFVINGEVTDISVIRSLEKQLKIDLISFLE